jgi:hypothetical protein
MKWCPQSKKCENEFICPVSLTENIKKKLIENKEQIVFFETEEIINCFLTKRRGLK